MTAGSIAILRSRRRHRSETVESVARDRGPSADSHAVSARAAPLRATPPRPDAERYVHTVRDLTFPIGDVAVGIGSHSLAGEREPKRSFLTPRGAFGRGGVMFTGGRIRDPMPSGTLTPCSRTQCEVAPTTARSASAVPVLTPSGQRVETCRSAL